MKNTERHDTDPDNSISCPAMYAFFPMETTCPFCGYDVQLWTDEDETKCNVCGFRLFQKESTIH